MNHYIARWSCWQVGDSPYTSFADVATTVIPTTTTALRTTSVCMGETDDNVQFVVFPTCKPMTARPPGVRVQRAHRARGPPPGPRSERVSAVQHRVHDELHNGAHHTLARCNTALHLQLDVRVTRVREAEMNLINEPQPMSLGELLHRDKAALVLDGVVLRDQLVHPSRRLLRTYYSSNMPSTQHVTLGSGCQAVTLRLEMSESSWPCDEVRASITSPKGRVRWSDGSM
ncbi:uncharacterized protein B0H18DRAFT_984842 [Fomitopsis serialis]|uniref:uncharacterized protein n=1 Tax=Fomitopsis serialis TaxID=139415 RepID=UPI002007490F|nr:uncharacterized protein B0H18DRAFT_984842 [Neoantrodia serialis]KAH9932958.1 hypothetical protein B0H18DRAFT_984842 [Neoantrodia serialis]